MIGLIHINKSPLCYFSSGENTETFLKNVTSVWRHCQRSVIRYRYYTTARFFLRTRLETTRVLRPS